jgi:hypothetical protein
MQVGFNYPVSYNRFGSEIGPDLWVDDAEWNRRNALEAAGQVSSIPLPPLFGNIDANLAQLKKLGISVVRWFLLGNGNNYGPAPTPYLRVPPNVPPSMQMASRYRDYNFTPPARLDTRFRRDFTELLTRFKKAGLQIIPSLISFEFSSAQRFSAGPRPNTGASGRADVIGDAPKRKIFFDTMLAELLAASAPFKDQIYAWEVANEPVWMFLDVGPNSYPRSWVPRYPEVTPNDVADFLADGISRINAAGFPSTVGHRYFGDLARLPTGTLPQFHYYADTSLVRRALGGVSIYLSDPAGIHGQNLFNGRPKPFLGEFGTDKNVGLARPWTSDFPSGDSTGKRLALLEKEGCDLAMIWIDLPYSATSDAIKLQPDTLRAIAGFTGGTP